MQLSTDLYSHDRLAAIPKRAWRLRAQQKRVVMPEILNANVHRRRFRRLNTSEFGLLLELTMTGDNR